MAAFLVGQAGPARRGDWHCATSEALHCRHRYVATNRRLHRANPSHLSHSSGLTTCLFCMLRHAALSQTNSSASGLCLRVMLGSPKSVDPSLSIASVWHTGTGCPICSLPLYDTLGCAEEFSVWQPRGAPVLLPPHALVKAVESIVAGLSSMTSSLVGKHHVWIKQQGRVPSKQEPLPLKVAQHKEVLGEPKASSCLSLGWLRQVVQSCWQSLGNVHSFTHQPRGS